MGREPDRTPLHFPIFHSPSQNMRYKWASHYCKCWAGLGSQVLSLVIPESIIMGFLFSLIVIFLCNSVSFYQKETFWGGFLTQEIWKIVFMLSKNTVLFQRKNLHEIKYSWFFRAAYGEVAETQSVFQAKSVQHLQIIS